MNSKKAIEKELFDIKKTIETLTTQREEGTELLKKKGEADETNTNLLALVKFMMDENRKTTIVLKGISEAVSHLTELSVEPVTEELPQTRMEELPVSELDASILDFIQAKGIACADDIKGTMNYKGRNAASARLNNLFKRGILQRYQLGHKVYYKFDAGKATNTLIVSPPH